MRDDPLLRYNIYKSHMILFQEKTGRIIMPRTNWKGLISFGLVSIPIMLFNSEDKSKKISFHQVDKRNKARIKYERINVDTGKPVPWEDIGKAYEYSKGNVLTVEEGELEKIAGENSRTIAIDSFVDKDSIEFIDIDKTYYLLPDKKGDKGYVILREALKETNKMGIAKVIISTKEYVAAIGCYENALLLYLLRYHDEIKPLEDFDFPSEDLKKYKATTKEVDVAKQLIKAMSAKWKPEKYKDEYQEAVHEWAANKIKHKGFTKMAPRSHAAKPTKTMDYVDLLKKSLGERKPQRGKTAAKKNGAKSYMKKREHHNRRASLH